MLQTLNISHFPFLSIYTYLVTCLRLFKSQNAQTVVIQTCSWDFPGSKAVISKCIIFQFARDFFLNLFNLGLFNTTFLFVKTPLNYFLLCHLLFNIQWFSIRDYEMQLRWVILRFNIQKTIKVQRENKQPKCLEENVFHNVRIVVLSFADFFKLIFIDANTPSLNVQ